jgi:hypothetical protein
MILNGSRDLTTDALLDLTNHDYTFYLDGSRYHGDATKESDFDFYTLDWDRVNHYLQGLVWKPVDYDYRDSNSVNIYYKGNVQVITVKNVIARQAIQKYMEGKPRSKDSEDWSALYDKYYTGTLEW